MKQSSLSTMEQLKIYKYIHGKMAHIKKQATTNKQKKILVVKN